jgi:hypothetical protein
MNSRFLINLGLALVTFAIAPAAALATSGPDSVRAEATVAQRAIAQRVVAQATEETPEEQQWEDVPQIQEGFMKGCVGTETLDEAAATTKQNYCQCAFESYSGRYSPLQFQQIEAVASRLGEEGPLLVSVMMAPELDGCSTTTGFDL